QQCGQFCVKQPHGEGSNTGMRVPSQLSGPRSTPCYHRRPTMAKQTSPRHYLLVHDAWQDSSCWDHVIPLLVAEGHSAQALDLPVGADASLAQWTATITAAVDHSAQPLVLVGHGSAGMAITAAAETLHPQLAALAYVAAMVPRDGESFLDLAERDPDSDLLTRLDVDDERGLVQLPGDAGDSWFAGCSDDQRTAAGAALHPAPLQPLAAAVTTSLSGFGLLADYRTYIECFDDRVLTLSLQRRMYNATPCPQQMTLAAGHAPYLTHPAELAGCLMAVEARS
ncbi:MAG: alpha/beta fold hydrolase, partial [Gammaproteobacteria bacterium]|nr:alpha/beta fold hydrolase [Gammaproteobacteria bacterium]